MLSWLSPQEHFRFDFEIKQRLMTRKVHCLEQLTKDFLSNKNLTLNLVILLSYEENWSTRKYVKELSFQLKKPSTSWTDRSSDRLLGKDFPTHILCMQQSHTISYKKLIWIGPKQVCIKNAWGSFRMFSNQCPQS